MIDAYWLNPISMEDNHKLYFKTNKNIFTRCKMVDTAKQIIAYGVSLANSYIELNTRKTSDEM